MCARPHSRTIAGGSNNGADRPQRARTSSRWPRGDVHAPGHVEEANAATPTCAYTYTLAATTPFATDRPAVTGTPTRGTDADDDRWGLGRLARVRANGAAATPPAARAVHRGLAWLLIVGRRQLERVLREYVEHYNNERAHRALDLRAPQPTRVIPLRPQRDTAVQRRDRLRGLIHEYSWAA
jgi:hypothetical protein